MKTAFYILPTRAWEMMIGSILVVMPPIRLSRRVQEGLSWLGLAGILFATFWYDSSTRFPGANAFLPCLGAGLLLWTNTSSLTSVGRLLSLPPMAGIGKLSYSLYLWHWPILSILRCRFGTDLPVDMRLGAVAASFLLGWLSWKFVETPLRSPLTLSRKQVYAFSTVCSVSIIAVCSYLMAVRGATPWCLAEVVNVIESEMSTRFIKDVKHGTIAAIGAKIDRIDLARFLLWGDSHAHAVSELVHEMAVKHQLAGFVAVRHGCVPLLEAVQHTRPRRGQKWNQKVIQFIKEKKIRNVILVSRWDVEVNDPKTALVDNPSDTPGENSRAIVFQKRLARTLVELEQAGARVWLMQDVPTNNYDVRRMLASKIMFHLDNVPDPVSLEKHRGYQATVTEFFQAAANNRVKLVDPTPYCFAPSGHARIWDAQLPYYQDADHLTQYGAQQLLTPLFDPLMAEIARSEYVAISREDREAPEGSPIRTASETESEVIR